MTNALSISALIVVILIFASPARGENSTTSGAESSKKTAIEQRPSELEARKQLESARRNADKQGINDSLVSLAQILYDQGRALEAEPIYAELLSVVEADQSVPRADSYAGLLNDIGANYWLSGKYDKAEQMYKRAIPIYEALIEKDVEPRARIKEGYVCVLNNLGNVYETTGDYRRALDLYKMALAFGESRLDPADSNLIDAIEGIGVIYSDQEQPAQAEPYLIKAVRLREQCGEKEGLADTLVSLACVNLSLTDYQEAEKNLTRALQIQEKLYGKTHPHIADTLIQLATLADYREQYDLAAQLLIRCIKIREELLGPDHFHTALALNNLAHVYQVQTDYVRAEPLYKRAVSICDKIFGADPRNLNIADVYSCYASFLYHTNNVAAAEAMRAKSKQVRDRLEALTSPE